MSNFDSEEFKALLTPTVKLFQKEFEAKGHEIRLCGGAVRDLLQGKRPKDIDFATTALPEEMLDICSANSWRTINTNGLAHGTVTIHLDSENFEITTLRIDRVTDGRRALVEYTKDWQLDAERRDLTFNAMFLGLDGTLYDYFNGVEDLKQKRVRFVGNAVKRIQEDYLRILRYFRFFGRINPPVESHDSYTLSVIKENAGGLKQISGERIWVELKQILVGNQAPDLVEKMHQLGLFAYFSLPGRDPNPVFREAYNRCVSLSPMPITVLSSLFDSKEEVLAFESRMKFSKIERLVALFIVDQKSQVLKSSGDAPELKYYQDLLVDNKEFPPLFELLKFIGDAETLRKLEKWEVPKFPVSGHELKNFGIKPGRDSGNILKLLREKWKASNFLLSKDDLLESVNDIVENMSKR